MSVGKNLRHVVWNIYINYLLNLYLEAQALANDLMISEPNTKLSAETIHGRLADTGVPGGR